MDIRLENLTWPDVKELIDSGRRTAIVPVGSVEQHGRHGPLGTDSFIVRAVAQRTAERIGAFCLPPLWFGQAVHHLGFPGSIAVRPRVLAEIVEDILESLIHHGIKNILVFNGHGGNLPSTTSACTDVKRRHPDVILAQSPVWAVLKDVYNDLPAEVRQDDWLTMISHGGLLETSIVMAVAEGAVKLDRAEAVSLEKRNLAHDPALEVVYRMEEIYKTGHGGDPRPASAELGEMFLRKTVEVLVGKYEKIASAFMTGRS